MCQALPLSLAPSYPRARSLGSAVPAEGAGAAQGAASCWSWQTVLLAWPERPCGLCPHPSPCTAWVLGEVFTEGWESLKSEARDGGLWRQRTTAPDLSSI